MVLEYQDFRSFPLGFYRFSEYPVVVRTGAPIMIRSKAIGISTLSAMIIFALAAGMARIAGIAFPPDQWAALVCGVHLLVWRRELAQ
jgi:hypothetical protein